MKQTQCEDILRYISEHGEITSRDAMIDLGIYRLASRITDLKKRGYQFDVTFGKGRTKYDRPMHYAIYRFKEQPVCE